LLGAALVTGNSVVYKPSERAPHTGALLGRILAETHPADVVRTVTGDGSVGAALTADPRVALVAHVGSTATGRAIREATARTGAKAVLENGGNDPLLIDRDVDPAWAAAQAATGAFANSGQICVAVERIYVHEDIADAFVSALIAEATDRELAPLVDRRHRDHVHAHVRDALDKGATGRAGGVLADGPGAHYPATVLTGCTPDMTVMREETFGPVAPVRVVADFEQGLREAAEGDYGLAATVLTGSVAHTQQAWHALPAGTVKINAVFGGAPGGAAEPRARSGQGFGFGPELLDELTATKMVHLEAPPSA
jgi:acyl-CoA reductase-like NAD-dependent aldehyde dehydrogenase